MDSPTARKSFRCKPANMNNQLLKLHIKALLEAARNVRKEEQSKKKGGYNPAAEFLKRQGLFVIGRHRRSDFIPEIVSSTPRAGRRRGLNCLNTCTLPPIHPRAKTKKAPAGSAFVTTL
ncbi:uncharacterized protein LOC106668222 [Cimex lectularius]|uniref:Uncharacterized protein n=1 Tax=Cimex lectularius TaxID=79782 RepID=A0A8I6RV86_CIMLE|nr:uncharacterized protein LOC106668222 [Cimex lectularius]